jgi:glycosyltransferase involved in cell wall biosynthesis
MNIVHICLACFYVDGMGYQENLLPKYHSEKHGVTIITSDFAFDNQSQTTRKESKYYHNEYGIPVIVLDKSNRFGPYSKYRDYDKLYETLWDLKPDVIFCHGGQFVALMDVIRYCKKNRDVKLFIDQHGDYYNSPVNSLRQKIGHKWLYGHWIRKAIPYTEKFWGVTPWRCQYLEEIYSVPKDKIGLLVMGGDDDKIDFENQMNIKKEIRECHNVSDTDFLIVTGGKIDKTKNIHLIVRALKEIDSKEVKLLVFGQPSNDFEQEFLSEVNACEQVRYIGWIPSEAVYDYFLSADLCVFPGTHSVLWEQACACGLPGVFKSWEGMQHVDMDGSAVFLYEDTAEEIKDTLLYIMSHQEQYQKMKCAANIGKSIFSYREIAQRAIDEGK